jgi:hypothetical protein
MVGYKWLYKIVLHQYSVILHSFCDTIYILALYRIYGI